MTFSRDQALVNRTLAGDLDAFGDLVQIYQASVFNVCYRVLGNRQDAEDLVQEAFLRAYNHLSSYDLERPFGPWMRTLAANLCYNKLNRRELSRVELKDERDFPALDANSSPESALEISQDHTDLYQALWELPHQQRIALELRHFQGLSYQEMADTLNLPINTVRSHLYRGRQKLTEILEEKENVF